MNESVETKSEERTRRRREMATCLTIAADMWELLNDEGRKRAENGPKFSDEFAVVAFKKDEILAVLKPHFPAPLSPVRVDALGTAIAQTVVHEGIDACSMWNFAHLLDHVLFDDLDNLRQH